MNAKQATFEILGSMRIKLRDGVDECPACGKLLIFEPMQKVRSAESEDVCSCCCGRSVWWLEWYAMRKRAEAERKAAADAIKVSTDKLDRAKKTIKNLMSAYLTKKEEERRKEDARRRKEEEDRGNGRGPR